ncbi:MAG: condensation domain-containing protein, partial [Bacteroidota bacterium]
CKRQHHSLRVAVRAATIQEGITALQQLEIPQQATSATPTLIVVESGHGDAESTLSKLEQQHPVLAPHVAACRATRVGITAQNAVVALHYVLYQGLQEMGIDTRNLLPVGLGKISAQLFQGQLSLEDALLAAQNTAEEPLADLSNRVTSLRNKRLGESHLVISLGHPGALLEELTTQSQHQPGIRIASVDHGGQNDIIVEAYQAGIEVLGKGFYHPERSSVVDLPPYAFLPKRVWLRDAPKEELPKEVSLETSTPAVLNNPSHSLEMGIAEIWAQVLAIPSLERESNFFELGGDSLKATRVIQQVNEQFSLRLDFEDLFDFPTLASFAQYVVETCPGKQVILSVWQEVLMEKDIEPQDNFFEKGGHSLLASQIISKVNQILGVKLDFNIFYQYPSVEAMAQYLESTPQQKEDGWDLVDAFATQSALTPNHQALWLGCLTPEGMRAYNQPNVYRLKGHWDATLLSRAFELLVERHDMLRTTISLQQGSAQLQAGPAADFFQGIQRIAAKGQNRDSILRDLEDSSQQLLSYETGPLYDLRIIEVSEEETWLYLNLHHLIADGWSMRILSSEFFALYQSLAEGKQAALPPLPMTFAGYSQGVVARLQTQAGAKSQAFWEEQLQRSALTTLPHGIESEENLTGTRHQISLLANTLKELKQEAEQQHATLFTYLLSAVALLLHKANGQNRITVGSPLAGRDEPQTQGMVGYFVNVVPITLEMPSTSTELLIHSGTMIREVLAHQHYPVTALEGYQAPQVTVVLQNTLNANLGKEGPQDIETVELPNEYVTAKTDLRIEAYELDTLYINLDYRTDRYEKQQMEAFGEALRDILDQLAQGAQIMLSEFEPKGWVPQNAALRAQFDEEF